LVVLMLAISAATAQGGSPQFTPRDVANARTLIRSVSNTADPKASVRCWREPSTLICTRYNKPARATRYYSDRFTWRRGSGGMSLVVKRGTKTTLIAIVRGISPTSFLIARVVFSR
jgi:hypothetical protein